MLKFRSGLIANGAPVLTVTALAVILSGCAATNLNATAPPAGSVSASATNVDGDANSEPAFVAASRGGLHVSALADRGRPAGLEPSDDDPLADISLDSNAENRLPGTNAWAIGNSPKGTLIEGFAGAASVGPGQDVDLYVSASAPTFTAKVLRTGYYSGQLARTVWSTPSPVAGGRQAAGVSDPTTRMVHAPWRKSLSIPTTGWPTGAYLAVLNGADGATSYVPFVVRAKRSEGAVLMVQPTTTWQAYNQWGGPSTYRGYQVSSKAEDYKYRAFAASYDRPYARGQGAATFITDDLPIISRAEKLGLHLTYATDLDLQLHPEVLDGAVGVVILGHSEYWSHQMRSRLTNSRDAGANLAFFSANDVHRRIRLESSALGQGRVIVNYKRDEDDPVKTQDTTADWGRSPFAEAQSSLIGTMFECAHSTSSMVISDPSAWPFAGLGLARGTLLPDVIGPEFDRVNTVVDTPRPLQILAHSPATCRGQASAADMTWYRAGSGAGVFASGTLNWAVAMATSEDAKTRDILTAATDRVLNQIAQPLAGVLVPPTDNIATYYQPNGQPIGADAAPQPAAPDVVDPDAD